MPRGPRPNLKRRETMLKLRAAGLSLAQIGKRWEKREERLTVVRRLMMAV